jgi:hypothetical protein
MKTYNRLPESGSEQCQHCGKPFAQLQQPGRKRNYCSTRCRELARNEKVKSQRPLKTVVCDRCGLIFLSKRKDARYCSKECSRLDAPKRAKEQHERKMQNRPATKTWTCGWCKEDMVVPVSYLGTRAYHDQCRVEARQEQNRRKSAKRRGARWAKGRTFHRDIAERDNFICHICNETVDMSLPRTHRFGATVDHVVPLAKGGTDEPDNLKLAHWICNTRKSDKLELIDA